MLVLAYPWLLLLLPLPALIWIATPARQVERVSLQVPFLDRLVQLTGRRPSTGAVVPRGDIWQVASLVLCWLLLVLAVSRPQWLEPPVTHETPMRDLLVAVDLSKSMEARDFTGANGEKIDRLTAARQVLDEFLAHRKGDRVGLIVFGSASFVLVPFTEDLDAARQMLAEMQVGMAGPQTVIGDAIGLSLQVFKRAQEKEKVLILLTDGNDTNSLIPPRRAAEIAHDDGVIIHTIGIGDPAAVGEEAFDQATLRDVAQQTGGKFFLATDRSALQKVYAEIDQMTTRKVETQSQRRVRDLFYWPLGMALLVSMLFHLLVLGRKLWQQNGKVASLNAVGAFMGLSTAVSQFHFLRPGWLLLLLPAGLILWQIRRAHDEERSWRDLIDPVLLDQLLVRPGRRQRNWPIYLLVLVWVIGTLAVAGPSWRREPSPFANDNAALVIVEKLTPSMLASDLPPDRLTRAGQKIGDLLKRRGRASTGFVVYAGSAHLVMPVTTDSGTITSFAAALQPDVMPKDGDDPPSALTLADTLVKRAGGGSILLIADTIPPDALPALAQQRRTLGAPVTIFGLVPPGAAMHDLEAAAKALDATLIPITADDADIDALGGAITRTIDQAAAADAQAQWRDEGYWLMLVIMPLVLFWFRRGWVIAVVRS